MPASPMYINFNLISEVFFMALVISFLITFWVAYLIYKKYKPQPVLVVGGFILMYTAVILGYGQILAPDPGA